MSTRVLLVRHAQSVWNAAGRWQGWADPPLSAEGELAASAAADHPQLVGIHGIVASDLQRARRTAAIIGAALGLAPAGIYRGLRERGAGQWTGLTRDEIERGWPGALSLPLLDIPGGESTAAVTARAVATLHRIAAAWPDRNVLAVTHGALIRLVSEHSGTQPTAFRNLSGQWVEVSTAIEAGPVVALSDTEAAPAEQVG